MKERKSKRKTAPEPRAEELPSREAMSVVEPPTGAVAAAAGLTVLNDASTAVTETEQVNDDDGAAP